MLLLLLLFMAIIPCSFFIIISLLTITLTPTAHLLLWHGGTLQFAAKVGPRAVPRQMRCVSASCRIGAATKRRGLRMGRCRKHKLGMRVVLCCACLCGCGIVAKHHGLRVLMAIIGRVYCMCVCVGGVMLQGVMLRPLPLPLSAILYAVLHLPKCSSCSFASHIAWSVIVHL